MADMLNDNPLSVAVELVLSTTIRALRAIASVLDLVIGDCVQQEPSLHSKTSAASAGRSGSNCTPCDPATLLGALTAILRRLISTVLTSLRRHYTAAGSQANAKRKSAVARTRASQTQTAAFNAMDDVLGGLYALVLAPIVRSFYPLSQGFVSACLEARSRSGSRTNPRSSGSGSSSKLPTDLRPALLALLDDSLSALEDVLPGSPAATSGPLSPGIGAKLAAAIPVAGHVKTLLALESVRELAQLYLPVRPLLCTEAEAEAEPPNLASDSVDIGRTVSDRAAFVINLNNDNSADPGPGPSTKEPTREGGRGDAASANSDRGGASTSRARHSWKTTTSSTGNPNHDQQQQQQHSQVPPRTFPGLAHVLYQNLPCPPGSRDDSTRPGTSSAHPLRPAVFAPSACATASASTPAAAASAGAVFTGLRSRWAGNLGETLLGATSGPGGGPVRGVPPASLAETSHAHAHAQRGGAGTQCAEDLRGRERERERVTRLARKDAVWYLCTALRRVLPAAPGSGGTAAGSGTGTGTGSRTGKGNGTGATTCTPPSSGPNNHPSPDAEVGVVDPSGNQGHGRGSKHASSDSDSDPPRAPSADTAAEQAVYDALADLLRLTQPRARRSDFVPTVAMDVDVDVDVDREPLSSPIVVCCCSCSSSSCPSASDSCASASCSSRTHSNHAGRGPRSTGPRGTNASHGHATPTPTMPAAGPGQSESEDPRERVRKRSRSEMEMEGMEEGVGGLAAASASVSVRMGEVERGMLLAVLERAWLGV
ncbi:hypothetical protein L227DRAFT_576224 [Lentinus tigrinus ALCF2SS1-6]|uniref:Uncharacterized protein n=2 Tax=Lentinus tigrinus TaxID=5365 RepID=A0A5C2S8J3_9APHY|nr:hypothetical protein L227DRAFT_576224 [Lentinus tigrinus ALCF2SS1-6]